MYKLWKCTLLGAAFVIAAACNTHRDPLTLVSAQQHADFCASNASDIFCRPATFALDTTVSGSDWTDVRRDFFVTLHSNSNRSVVEAWGESVTVRLEQDGTVLPLSFLDPGNIEDTFIFKLSRQSIGDTFGKPGNNGSTIFGGSAKLIVTFIGSDGTSTPTEIDVILPSSSGGL